MQYSVNLTVAVDAETAEEAFASARKGEGSIISFGANPRPQTTTPNRVGTAIPAPTPPPPITS